MTGGDFDSLHKAAQWAPTLSISLSNLAFIYLRNPHWVADTCRNRAATSISAEFPSGKAPTTLVRRRASRSNRSIGLLVRIFNPCCEGKE